MTKTFSEYVVDWFRNMVESGKVNTDDLFEFMEFIPNCLDEGESAEDYLMGLDDGIDIWNRLFNATPNVLGYINILRTNSLCWLIYSAKQFLVYEVNMISLMG